MNRRPPLRLLAVAVWASLGTSFHFGFQLTLTNPSQAAFINFLNHSLHNHYGYYYNDKNDENALKNIWSAVVAVLFVGGVFGAVFLHKVAERFGRKGGLIFTSLLNAFTIVLSIISYFISSIELYAISRFISGCSLAISLGLTAIYLTECSPKACRGSVSMVIGVVLQCGVLAGAVLGIPALFGVDSRWWLIYVVELVIVLLTMLGFAFVHESPSYLLQHGREAPARRSIQFYHGCVDAPQLDASMDELRELLLLREKSLCMWAVWTRGSSYDRKGALIGCLLGMAIIFSGIATIMAYSVDMLTATGLNRDEASYYNICIMGVSMITCLVSTFFADRWGRRKVLLVTYFAALVANIAIFLIMLIKENSEVVWVSYVIPVIFSLFALIISIGPGPISFFLTSEMLSQNARSAGQSWSFLVQMACRAVVLAIFPPMMDALNFSWAYLILFVAPVIFTITVFYFYLPETKNRNILEIQKEFEKLPTLKTISSSVSISQKLVK